MGRIASLSKSIGTDWPPLLASTGSAHTVRYSKNSLTFPYSSLIFVHGLTGDREKTWTAKDVTEPWPKTLLPSKVPNARILTFGYDAYISDWRGMVSKNRIGNHAMNLLSSVASYREEDDTVCPYRSSTHEAKLTVTGQPSDHIHLPQPRRSCV
jgi:hypothetical protein